MPEGPKAWILARVREEAIWLCDQARRSPFLSLQYTTAIVRCSPPGGNVSLLTAVIRLSSIGSPASVTTKWTAFRRIDHLVPSASCAAIDSVGADDRRVGKECRSRWSPNH